MKSAHHKFQPLYPESLQYPLLNHQNNNNSQINNPSPKGIIESDIDAKDEFCKRYSGIKLNYNAPFQERMQFDIYKRKAKPDKYEILLNSQKVKITKEEADKVFSRLYEDTQKRLEQKKESDKPIIKESNDKKMSDTEMQQFYNQLMDKWRKSQETIEEKRRVKKEKEELEEKQIIQRQNKLDRRRNSCYNSLIERMDTDIEQRRKRQKERETKEKQKITNEIKKMFKPVINKRNHRREIATNVESKANASVYNNNYTKKTNTKDWDKENYNNLNLIDTDEKETERCNNNGILFSNLYVIIQQKIVM